MPARNELAARAAVVGIDHTVYPNDSKLEQKVLFMEKNATAQTGTISTTTLTSTGTAVSDGDTVTLKGRTYTAKTTLTEAAASGTLTSDATAPADGDLVHIDGVTYVYRTTLTVPATANEVLIGVSAAVALDNLKSAITVDGTSGVYASNTVVHPTVTATTNTNTTQLVVAKAIGVAGNSILTSETSAHLSWGGSSLASGADSVANEVLIGSTSDGSAFLTNLRLAINGLATAGTNYSSATSPSIEFTATTVSPTTTQVINSSNFAIQNGDIATTETSSQLSFTSTVMASGVSKVIAPITATTTTGVQGISDEKNHA